MSIRSADISVIVPHRNRLPQLQTALGSIGRQTCQPLEVIIIDDGSSPPHVPTLDKIKSCIPGIDAIKIVLIDAHRGANHARNRGLAVATHHLIAFLDSDDIWLPTKLERQILALGDSAGQGPVFCTTGRYRAYPDGTIICRQASRLKLSPETIRQSNFVGTLSSVLVDRASLETIGGFDETFDASQDWDLYIRLSDLHPTHVSIPEPLCVYVEHPGPRISSAHRAKVRSLIKIARIHVGAASLPWELCQNLADNLRKLRKPRSAHVYMSRAIMTRLAIPQHPCARGLFQRVVSPIWTVFHTLKFRTRRLQFLAQRRDPRIDRQARYDQKTIFDVMRATHRRS